MACLFSCKVDTLNKMYALITTEMNMFIKTVKPRIKEVRMHQDSQGKIDIIINHFCHHGCLQSSPANRTD